MLYFFPNEAKYTYMTPTLFASGVGSDPTKVSAAQYLEYARSDVRDNGDRGLINALGNAKRAFHIVVDSTLRTYGLLANSKHANFVVRLNLLDSADLLPIAILRQLNLERNLVEHEYEIPSRQRVLEAIDVVRLLLLSTKALITSVAYETIIGIRGGVTRHALMRLNPYKGALSFHRISLPGELSTYDGVEYFPGHIRIGDEFREGVHVDCIPFQAIGLTTRNVEEWCDLIQALVKINMDHGADRVMPRPENGGFITMTVPVEIAAPGFVMHHIAAKWAKYATKLTGAYEELPAIER